MPDSDLGDFQAVIGTPAFSLGIRCSDEAITEVRYLEPALMDRVSHPLAGEAARQIKAYLTDPHFVFDLPLAASGTEFQRRVWSALKDIASGETRTYGELARALGTAPRAVGQACGANRCPVIVPCHRVTATHGIGGFAHQRGGYMLDVKRWLLAHERR